MMAVNQELSTNVCVFIFESSPLAQSVYNGVFGIHMNRLNNEKFDLETTASFTFYLFSSTHLINSIKLEHSCKILYIGRPR